MSNEHPTKSTMKNYTPLNQQDPEDAPGSCDPSEAWRSKAVWRGRVLAMSFVCNILVGGVLLWGVVANGGATRLLEARTLYAGLQRDKSVPLSRETPFNGHNLTETRRLWQDISIDPGMVALPDSFVATHGLPAAQRYPWDHSKGLYFLNGYHNLHCLRAVHMSLMEFAYGERQSRRFHHVLHCMEALRQDVICNADDTPRYTTADDVAESGVGQARKCRDWSKLERFAQKHNACYHFINQTATGFPNVLRYTWCPEGSPDMAEVTRIMGGSHLTEFL